MHHGHGCQGAGSNYMKTLALDLTKAGFQAVVMVRRGVETHLIKKPRMYQKSVFKDVFASVKYLKKHFNNPNFYTAGCSFGAGLISLYSGILKEAWPFKAQVCLATPFCLTKCIKSLESLGNEMENLGMTYALQCNVLNNYDVLKEHEKEIGYDLDQCLKVRRITQFDELFTAPQNGFKNAAEFYEYMSSKNFVKEITIPTLFIHSMDDPVCVSEVIPFSKIQNNPNVFMVLTKKGGHIQWFTGFQNLSRWAYKPTIEFLLYQAKLNGDMD